MALHTAEGIIRSRTLSNVPGPFVLNDHAVVPSIFIGISYQLTEGVLGAIRPLRTLSTSTGVTA